MAMRFWIVAGSLTVLMMSGAQAAEVITGGSGSVTVGGESAARAGDTTSSGNVITGGSSNVFINGKPAATAGDSTSCGGLVVTGDSSVLINGKPMAKTGGSAVGCADK